MNAEERAAYLVAHHERRLKAAGKFAATVATIQKLKESGRNCRTQTPKPPPEPPCTGRIGQPGSLIKSILKAVGIQAMGGCGCEAFCRRMNAWGWTGCIANRAEIYAWFIKKAKDRNIELGPRGIVRIVRGAITQRHTATTPGDPDHGQ